MSCSFRSYQAPFVLIYCVLHGLELTDGLHACRKSTVRFSEAEKVQDSGFGANQHYEARMGWGFRARDAPLEGGESDESHPRVSEVRWDTSTWQLMGRQRGGFCSALLKAVSHHCSDPEYPYGKKAENN